MQDDDIKQIVEKLNQLRMAVDMMEDQLIFALNKIQNYLEEGENSEALEFVKTLLIQVEEDDDA